MPVNRLERIDFGVPAAERDRGLGEVFVESELFTNVLAGRTTVILGNRGAGKSAILQMLAKRARADQAQVIQLSPEDYSYEILCSTMEQEEDGAWAKQGAYAAAWKYMLYIEAMKVVATREGKSENRSDSRIRRYVRDNHRTDLGRLSSLISYMKRLEGLKLGPVEASVKTRELQKLYKLEEIAHLLPELAESCRSRPVLILVDELDKGWDSSEEAKAFIAGLFQACLSINEQTQGLTTYISLRQELYDEIPALYEDAQKYRDLVETISWSRDELQRLIAHRIRKSVPSLSDLSDERAWSRIFRDTLEDDAKSFDYVLDRTLHRPRELIQFCTELVHKARRVGLQGQIGPETIHQVEPTYSHERVRDIAAEYRFAYADLASIFEVFRGRPAVFRRDELEFLALQIAGGEEIVSPGAKQWVDSLDEQVLIDALWRVGFLQARLETAQPRRAPSYLSHHAHPYVSIHRTVEFRVHPMFHAYLGIA